MCRSPDASAVGPVTGHSGAGQQGRHGLVEKEVIIDQQILLSIGHAAQGEVLSLELTLQTGQGFRGNTKGGGQLVPDEWTLLSTSVVLDS